MSHDPSKSLATLFFRNRYLLTLSIVVILVGGLSSFLTLPRLEDPRIVNRAPIVITPVPGASAERVETLVTEVLEEALQEIVAIKDIESTSRAGVSILGMELEPSVDSDTNKEIFAEIRDKIGEVTPLLPPEARDPIVDDKRDPVAFTLIVALTWTAGGEPHLGILNRLAETLADEMRQVPGTELVRIYGAPEEEITVTLDPGELAELGLSAAQLSGLVAASDAKGPAGVLRGARSNVLLEVSGELDSLERIARIPVAGESSDGSVLRLGDVAAVERGWRDPPEEIGLVDGRRSVLVAVRMEAERRVDLWAEDAEVVLAEFKAGAGTGIAVEPIFEQERYTTERLTELGENLFFGALVVIAVIFLMMGWRMALVVGFALPLVVSAVMFSWQATGSAIHQMSVFGMIIALGLLIDNAIVVADEISRHRTQGRAPLEAVDKAVRHLFFPLLASTTTTVLAFSPILLLPGGAGDFVGSIGSSVITAIAASFAIALTITAALAGLFAKPSTDGSHRFWRDGLGGPRLSQRYRRFLTAGIRHPVAALLVALFLPFAGFLAARSLGNEFFPPVDRDMFHVQLWLPTDSAIENTRAVVEELEAVIRGDEEVERVHWLVGGSFPTVYYNLVMGQDDSPHYAQGIVKTASAEATGRLVDELQGTLDRRFPGAQIVARPFGQGPPVVADVEYRLYGPDLEQLQVLGERYRRALQAHPEVLHTQITMPRGKPKLWLDADEDEARLAGFSFTSLAGQLQTSLEGRLGGSVLENLEQMPVRVRFTDDQRSDLSEIASLPLARSGGGDWISLQALGELEMRPVLGGLTRFNGERTNIVKGYTRDEALPIEVTGEVLAELEAGGFELPPGYRLELGGALEQDSEAKANLAIYAPVLVVLAVATLILAFGSVRMAILLGSVAILSVGLGLLSTWTMGFPISFNTILGTLGLIGVALNDSIVVLASIRSNPAAKGGDCAAIVEEVAGSTRHVLSTTLTTMGGFLPLLIFVGGDFWPSLAIVLVGGIAGASILALVLVPSAYVLLLRPRERCDDVAAPGMALSGGAA